ncbi:ABC transporter substrate-binding protein [Ottowia thiooxydans]|uniref:Iron(III) transport system substrate-binding protein n=1 Tax=Ottowia thiooxydans TaxID=219182 RepID=A0ABV2Q751_9BURK
MKKLTTAAFGLAFALAPFASAHAQSLAELAKTAASKPPVTWYESSPSEQIDKVLAAFGRKYPSVKVRHTRLVGGNELAVRGVQEMQARGYTGDLLTGGADHMSHLKGRGYLEGVNWSQFGVPKSYAPNPEMVATTASVYVALWNTRKVTEAESPKTWEDVLNPKWTNRVGSWVRAASFAQLAATQGPDSAKRQLERFIKLKPMLYKSTFPLAQAVGSGEVDMGIGFYHSTLPPMNAGAPIQMRALDVVPMHMIYSGVSKGARNPEGAKLLMAWLTTNEGALAYEEATGRGNPLVTATKTAKFIAGKKVSEWPPEKSDELGALNEYYNKMLEAVGSAK